MAKPSRTHRWATAEKATHFLPDLGAREPLVKDGTVVSHRISKLGDREHEVRHEVGVFAQRTKYRPNPIGVTAVRVTGIEGNVIKVRGLDAMDGTPVLDLKPYIPPFDRVDDVKLPPWVAHVMEGYF